MIVLKNTTYIDWKSLEFKIGNILVNQGINKSIVWIKDNEIPKEADVIDCTGKYVTKSFGNAHHHAYSALAVGMPPPPKPPTTFYEILKCIWWRLDKALDTETIKICALITAIECAKNGVTFVIDHHASPFAIKGALQTISDAFNEVGVNHLLCYELSDRDGQDIAKIGLAETAKYLEKNQGLVGLHASFTLTKNTLNRAVELAKKYNSGIHVHVAEDLYDQEHCYDIHNKRVVERFSDLGILNMPKSLLVHCLYLTDDERRLIKKHGTYVVQNTESNLNNGVGQFKSCMLGNHIMLGTDGMHSDMLRAAKATYFNGLSADVADAAEIYSRFRNIHNYLGTNSFTGDGENNLIILDYQPHTPFNAQNFIGHFFYGINASHIESVIANGKLIVAQRKVTQVNESSIRAMAQQVSLNLWEKMKTVTV